MYPVPARELVKLRLNTAGFGDQFRYTITDMNGKKLIQANIPLNNANGQTTELTLNVNNLPAGMYQLNYSTREKTISRKLVIAK
jgi:hypothetical protein